MVGFVDDSTGQVNDFLAPVPLPPKLLLAWMQHDAQLWTDLLWTSGGLLELPKCSFHFLHFEFHRDGRPFPKTTHHIDQLDVTDAATGRRTAIQSKSVYQAHKTLGHHKAPAGQSTTQFDALCLKARSLLRILVTTSPTPNDAQLFYHSIYLPAMRYPMPQSHLSSTQLRKLDQLAIPTLASRSGFNRNTARDILFGPHDSGGGNFVPSYVLQGEGQILHFLKHWRSPTTAIGKALRVAAHWTQALAGVSWPILQYPARPLPHVNVRWLASLRRFLAQIQATLEVDDPGVYPAQREHDKHLMDIALTSTEYSPTQIQSLNGCRLYLQVTTISDMTTPDGTHIDPGFWSGVPSLASSVPKTRYPYQERMPVKAWRLWAQFCTLLANHRHPQPDGSVAPPRS